MHLMKQRPANPGGQDDYITPVNQSTLKFELGLRHYQGSKHSTETKPWRVFTDKSSQKKKAAIPLIYNKSSFNDKFNGPQNSNLNSIRHILNDKISTDINTK